ncbi:MAG: LuxR C-terminal-related transcriptional regulator [Cytophagales bacterium]|nr:LuxR C-terminal-related transcriptional regulator [Cytophagales bacterium]MDW8383503.1 LuxR C-terminal-related transcriptional regulator [Flammeovirgaceae bacterium]
MKLDKKAIQNTANALRAVLEELEGLLQLSGDAHYLPAIVYTLDIESGDAFGNYNALKTLGYETDEIEKKQHKLLEHLIHPEDQHLLDDILAFFRENRGDFWVSAVRLRESRKIYHYFTISAIGYEKNQDRIRRAVVVLTDITHFIETDKQFRGLVNQEILSSISKREKQIIKLIAQGYRNVDIANELDIRVPTVETHRKNIYKKLKLRNTADLITFAHENRLLD